MSRPIVPFFLFLALLLSGCAENDDPSFEIPETYDFANVDYSGQTQRLAMLAEMKAYMNTSTSEDAVLDADRLQAMFENDAPNAGWQGTYEASKQLKGKTFQNQQSLYEGLFQDIAQASTSSMTASSGQAGRISSLDGSRTYLVGANGLEYLQMIEKGLMGACFYWQATDVYMGPDRMNVDNEAVTPGEGTEMEHHWDEAFGYFGVPTNYPLNADGAAFWGKYALDRDPLLGTARNLMEALIKGRAAISAKDLDTRDEAITEARMEWERVSVGTALHYINSTLNNFDDPARRLHALSEAIAFTYDLQFNPDRGVTPSQVQELLTLLAGNSDFGQMDLWSVTEDDLTQARSTLAGYYGLEDQMDQF